MFGSSGMSLFRRALAATIGRIYANVKWRIKHRMLIRRDPFLYK